jgi:hypothetical protein
LARRARSGISSSRARGFEVSSISASRDGLVGRGFSRRGDGVDGRLVPQVRDAFPADIVAEDFLDAA